MAAIISDKFRIFNATQFLESLSEGPNDASAERSRMYFFVGRSQPWAAYLEIYSKSTTGFTVGREVFVGTSAGDYGSTAFRGTISAVYENALLLTDIFGSGTPASSSVPTVGSTISETGDAGSTITAGVSAKTGVYRYGTEDVPPLPLDNQREKRDIYDELIAAKRITTVYARSVIRRYNWNLTANPKFDMWKPDYSATPTGGGQTGKQSATGESSIADSKFYVMNSTYEVWKCLYNGETPANPLGQNASEEPSTASGNYNSGTGLYTEATGAGYIWKYMYTIPTSDVLKFLSSDFMPIVLPTDPSRIGVVSQVVDGAIDAVLIEDAGANLPSSATLYAGIQGDGTGGVVRFVTNGSGTITSASVQSRGSGYTYANVILSDGFVFSNQTLTSTVSVGNSATGAIEAILPPEGGHGSNHEQELNGKRVMTNVRLTYAEGDGDFPVDNDFRRIGLLRDPYKQGTTTFEDRSTVSGLKAIRITGATADYIADERIEQVQAGETAYGTVVSWTLDENSTTEGVLKYYQTNTEHSYQGKVRDFASNGAQPITGAQSNASGSVATGYSGSLLGSTFASGLANSDLENNSGEVIYIENRRLITRAPDQIEDIKLVIEF